MTVCATQTFDIGGFGRSSHRHNSRFAPSLRSFADWFDLVICHYEPRWLIAPEGTMVHCADTSSACESVISLDDLRKWRLRSYSTHQSNDWQPELIVVNNGLDIFRSSLPLPRQLFCCLPLRGKCVSPQSVALCCVYACCNCVGVGVLKMVGVGGL